MRHGIYFVYILSSRFKTLYVGVTNDLERRLHQHRDRRAGTFTARYRITRLVYYETFSRPAEAITREKQIKGWRRERKVELIQTTNPQWQDLSSPDTGLSDPSRGRGDRSGPEGGLVDPGKDSGGPSGPEGGLVDPGKDGGDPSAPEGASG